MSKSEIELIFDLLKEMREDQKTHGKELYLQSAKLDSIDSDAKELKTTVSKNTEDIAYHIRRTDILEKLHLDNQARIVQGEQRLDKLEEPRKAISWLQKNVVSIISLIATIIAILAFFTEKK